MRYATQADMEVRFGADALRDAALAGTDASDPAPRIKAALDDASAAMDAALVVRFDLPLPAGHDEILWGDGEGLEWGDGTTIEWVQLLGERWRSLRSIACDLARERLYVNSVPEAVTEAANRARRLLSEIASGGAQLVASDGTSPETNDQPRQVAGLPGAKRKTGVFTPSALEGF